MMYRSWGVGAIVLSFLFVPSVFAVDVTMTTYYPSPSGNYDQLQASKLLLSPSNGAPFACSGHAGAMYFDQSNNTSYICDGTTWTALSSQVWGQSTDGTAIYPIGMEASPVVNSYVGIGVTSPEVPLHIALPAGQVTGLLIKGASGSAGVSVLSSATGVSAVNLGSVNIPGDGSISYNNNNASRTMTFMATSVAGMTLKGTNLSVVGKVSANNLAVTNGVTAASVAATGAVSGGSVSAPTITATNLLKAANIQADANGLGAAAATANLCVQTYGAVSWQNECPSDTVQVAYSQVALKAGCKKLQLKTCP